MPRSGSENDSVPSSAREFNARPTLQHHALDVARNLRSGIYGWLAFGMNAADCRCARMLHRRTPTQRARTTATIGEIRRQCINACAGPFANQVNDQINAEQR